MNVLQKLTFLFFIIVATSAHAQSSTLCLRGGACFAPSGLLESQELVLRGKSDFRYFGFRLYGAALYAPAAVEDVWASFGEEPLELHIHYYRAFSADDFVRSGTRYFAQNPRNRTPALEEALLQMNGLYKPVSAGDVYIIRFLPGQGVELLLNRELQGKVETEFFGPAYLGIWLWPGYSLGESFSNRLLGKE